MFSAAHLYLTVVSALFIQYPEIARFAEQSVVATEEGSASERLGGWTAFLVQDHKLPADTRKPYIELERMLQSVVCLHVLLQGINSEDKINLEAYNYWVQQQPAANRLPEEDFLLLARATRRVCAETTMLKAVEACLIYSDLGKTSRTQELAKAAGIKLSDHNDLMQYVLTLDNASIIKIIPSFSRLPPAVQDAIRNVYDAVPLHWAHVSHLEGGTQMFNALLASPNFSRAALEQSYLINMCDIAGAAAHVDFRGAVAFNKITSIRYGLVLAAIENLLAARDPHQTLDFITTNLGKKLGFTVPLSSNDTVLTRMAAFLRLTTQDEGRMLKQASAVFSAADWELMQQMFGKFTGVNTWQRNPTYMPALLLNVFNFNYRADEHPNTRYKNAIAAGRWLAQYCASIASSASYAAEPINFNKIAGEAKQNPEQFLQSSPAVRAKEDAESEEKSITEVTAVIGKQGPPVVSAFSASRQQQKYARPITCGTDSTLQGQANLVKKKHHL